jgi:hypothetical protein
MKQENKKCKICGNNFYPSNNKQIVCGLKCSIDHSNKQAKENILKDHKLKKKIWYKNQMKITEWKEKFQKIFNSYIRERDRKKNCVSCDRKLIGKFDAGHFFDTTYQFLRFNENNVHAQCVHCNKHKRSNAHEYRFNIIKRITIDDLKYLDIHRNDKCTLTVEEIKALIDLYRQKTKDLKKK